MSQHAAGRMPWEMVDVLILTATREEYEAVLAVDSGALPESPWEKRTGPRALEVAFRAFETPEGGTLRVAATCLLEQGGVAKPSAAASFVRIYSPRCLAVCGVCKGREGAVKPGDVIIADQLWTADFETLGDILPYQLSARWKQAAGAFKARLGGIAMPGAAGREPERNVLGFEARDSVLPALAHRQDVTYRLVVKAVTDPSGSDTSAAQAAAACLLALLRAQLPSMQCSGRHARGGNAELEALLVPGTGELPTSESIHSEIMRDLQAWCEEDEPVSVRLFLGAADSGKTRLFDKGCEQLRGHGWRAGFLGRAVEPDCFEALLAAAAERPTLVVIVRAESHPALGALLQAVVHRRKARGPGRFRLVLLAREVGGWWEILQRRSLELRKLLKGRLPTQVSPSAPGEPDEEYLRTWMMSLLEGGARSRAIHALEALKALGQRPIYAAAGQVLAQALQREGTLEMAEKLDAAGLPELTPPLREIAVWVKSTLLSHADGGESPQALIEGARLRSSLGALLSALGRKQEALVLAREVVERYRKLVAAHPEMFRQDLALGLADLGVVQGELGQREESLASLQEVVALRRELTEENPEEFLPSLAVNLNGMAGAQSALGRRDEALSSMQEAVSHYQVLTEEHREMYLPELAASLNNLSSMQGSLGRQAESLASIQAAVGHYRRVAKKHPESALPELAGSLTNLGILLGSLGQREESLAAVSEAVGLYRQLMEARLEEHLPRFAASLNSLSVAQSALGRRKEALASIQEAVELRRKLAETQPQAFLPDLAMSLVNLSIFQNELGQREQALASVREAADHYRKLAEAYSAAYLPALAICLSNLAAVQSSLGRSAEALAPVQEAVEYYRRLAKMLPAMFLGPLASSLSTLGSVLSGMERWQEALAAVQEAVELRRKLAEEQPKAVLPELALSLSNLGTFQSALGRREEALASLREAVEIRRRLVAEHPEAFEADLAVSLNNLGSLQGTLGQGEEALASLRQAVEIRRKLAAQHPEAFSPDLAVSLTGLGKVKRMLGQRQEALASLHEALDILWPFFLKLPTAFASITGPLLHEVAVQQQEAGSPPPSSWKERVETWAVMAEKAQAKVH